MSPPALHSSVTVRPSPVILTVFATSNKHKVAEVELILALTKGLREARADGLPLDDVLADRLVEYVSGVRLREPQMQNPLLALNSLLAAGEPPKRDLLPGK